MDSLLVAAGLGTISILGPENYIQTAILLALLVGITQFLLGLLKMGFFVSFLSKPLIRGFTSGAAIIIGLSQIKHILGVSLQSNKIQLFAISIVIRNGNSLSHFSNWCNKYFCPFNFKKMESKSSICIGCGCFKLIMGLFWKIKR